MARLKIRLLWVMCSRFELNTRPRDLARHFDIDNLPDGFTTGEIRPTNPVLCIGPDGPVMNTWGLSVDWDNKPIINARSETLSEKRTFQPLLQSRCLVPASAYFEWRRDGKRRHKNRVAMHDQELFAFAGLTDGQRVTIVTCTPIPNIAHIHGRMPVILERDTEGVWVDPSRSYQDVAALTRVRNDLELGAAEDTLPPPRQGDLFEL